MPFVLTERVLNPAGDIEITEAQFLEIGRSRLIVMEALAIEEKYALLLQNYFELERVFHDLALSTLLFRGSTWTERIDEVHTVNRHLVNLLSAAKMYVDHVPQHLNEMFVPSEAESRAFAKETSNEFESVLGYRVLSALRNHAQHADFPIQSLSLGSKWVEEDGVRRCRHTATAFIHRDVLTRNAKINAKVRSELSSLGETIDVKPLLREYLSSFARIHVAVRSISKQLIEASDRILESAQGRYKSEVNPNPAGLAAIELSESGTHVRTHSVFTDAIVRRERLERRSSTLSNLHKHFVSGSTA